MLPPLFGRLPLLFAQFEVETTTLDTTLDSVDSVGFVLSGCEEVDEFITLFDGLFEYLDSVKLFSCDDTERLY